MQLEQDIHPPLPAGPKPALLHGESLTNVVAPIAYALARKRGGGGEFDGALHITNFRLVLQRTGPGKVCGKLGRELLIRQRLRRCVHDVDVCYERCDYVEHRHGGHGSHGRHGRGHPVRRWWCGIHYREHYDRLMGGSRTYSFQAMNAIPQSCHAILTALYRETALYRHTALLALTSPCSDRLIGGLLPYIDYADGRCDCVHVVFFC